jgi:uncharacterized protein with HEPN domain
LSFKDPHLSLRHIFDGISMIEQFTAGVSLETFRDDPMRVAAVERYLQKISEAAVRLGDQAETLCPGLPWRDIRGIGNWLRHQYDRVDLETLWNTAIEGFAAAESCRGKSVVIKRSVTIHALY